MEENVLIKSEALNVKKVFVVMVIIGIVISVLFSIIAVYPYVTAYNGHYSYFHETRSNCYSAFCIAIQYDSAFEYALHEYFEVWFGWSLLPVTLFALIGGLAYLYLRGYELTVTDKRIYGKVAWGKRVDLPVDSVSATATIRLFKGVSVSTSSGRISFLAIKNADEIYTTMSNLIIERQQKKTNFTFSPVTPALVVDETDKLKKYKELLDMGIITQEEFDAKKKELLGL